MKKIALIAVLFAATGMASAANLFGDTVNNNQTYNQPQGGAGGQGGKGGDASAIAGASSVAEAKAAAAAIAAQQQSQSMSNKIDNKNSNTNLNAVNSSNKNDNSNKNSVENKVGVSNAVTVQGDSTTFEAQKRDPVATAYAASIAPTAVCALSVSGGAQAVGFGFSFGKSYIDENCVLLEQARAASNLGQREIAVEMLMDLPAFAAAKQRVEARKAK